MELYLFVLLTFLISAFIGWFTIPRIVIISKKKRLFDVINERKLHKGAIPRLGGISFFPGCILSFALVLGLRYSLGYTIGFGDETTFLTEFLFVLSGALILFFIGLADDLVGVSYKGKFLAQIVAGVMLVYSGLCITNLGGLFGLNEIPYGFGVLLTIVLVVFVINAFNLIDGVDGLCSSLAMLALSTLGIWFILNGFFVYAMMAFGMVGVVFMFLIYNTLGSRLKVFMGDTGALTVGFIVVFLGLKFYALNINSLMYRIDSAPAFLMGLLFVPAFDAVRVFFTRINAGLSPFYADKRHIHHKFIKLGFSHLQCTAVIILVQTGFIIMNIMLNDININLLFGLNIALGLLINFILNHAIRLRETEKLPKTSKIKKVGI